MLSLDDIINGCKKYDKAFQHLLYEKYALKMRHLCYRYLTNADDLDDVVHDGFIKVFVKIEQYSGKGSFEGWLIKIFINTSFEYNNKSQKNRRHLNIELVQNENNDDEKYINMEDNTNKYNEDLIDDVSENYLEAVQMADFSEAEILDVINEIPEKLKNVFNLFCIEGFSHDEISKLLEIDAATSRTRLLRARNLIKKYLYEFCLTKSRI